MPNPRWSAGDTIVLRFVGHDDGVAIGYPQVVVEDSEAHLVLFQPAGVTVENRRFTDVNLRDAAIPLGSLGNMDVLPPTYTPRAPLLRILPHDAEHAVELYFEGLDGARSPGHWLASEGYLRGYKVNIQSRYVRTPIGIDTTDNRLDLVMPPTLEWSRKDVEQLAAAVASGLTYEWESAFFHAEAERVIAAIEARAHPFDGSWAAWRPDPAWPYPVLPSGWHKVEGVDLDLNRARPLYERTT
ncbi:MAG: DUF402 domain-containing protein [Dehalococcoidia bacterium]|nr:MAG: DUF402 domain-containing protein [Dehalococcoidia bacterium]